MNIHEHQAKGLLRKFGVSVPDGYSAFTVEEAVNNAKKLPGPVYVCLLYTSPSPRDSGAASKPAYS